jgi:Domain of unknown function (DUF4082)
MIKRFVWSLMCPGILLGIMLSAHIALAQKTETLFGTGEPAIITVQDPNAVELGVKFTADIAGQVSAIRFYKGPSNKGTHIGHLWTAAGTLLASATFTGETKSGWQTAQLSAPVNIAAGATYVVSYWCPDGYYSASEPYFTKPYVSNDLRAPIAAGVYVYAGYRFPTQTWNDSNYFVDLSFSPQAPPPPTLSLTVTPADPSIAPSALPGEVVATLAATWSDSSPFTGTYGFAAPYSNDGGRFALQGNELVVGTMPLPPGTTQNVTVDATQ